MPAAPQPASPQPAASQPAASDPTVPSSPLTRLLQRAPTAVMVLFGGTAAFCVYFSMYAFRKPYAAATYEHVSGWGFAFDFKSLLVISQILGYALSKVVGVKVISEMPARRRAPAILVLILASWVGLVLFAVLPATLKPLGLFLNGLPLGLIWGLVFGFLEGRRTTEILGALLSASFIVSSGVVKTVALFLMSRLDVDEFWMPAATGALFLPLRFVSVYGLSRLPAPDAADVLARTERRPMDGRERRAFMAAFGPGVLALVAGYILLTVLRDFRDDFAVEIWWGLGFADDPGVLTRSEIPVAIFTLMAFAALILIRDNLRALLTIHLMTLAGAVILAGSAILYLNGAITPLALMIGTGTGLYIAYMPFGAMLFERLIASTRQVANAGFLICLADASGYLGTVTFLIAKNLLAQHVDWLSVFLVGAIVTGAVCGTFTLGAMVYFARRLRALPQTPEQVLAAESAALVAPAAAL